MKMIPVLPPESPRTTKLMVGIVVTIFLGAIGSGLWDRMLSHVFDWSLTLFLTVISRVFRSYVDYIHEDIGKGAHEIFSMLPFIALVVAIICFPWLLMLAGHRMKKRMESVHGAEEVSRSSSRQFNLLIRGKYVYWVVYPMLIFITLAYSSMLFETAYLWRATNFVERSIDILAPNLTEHKVLELRAEYRSVNNAKKFYALEDSLVAISERDSIEIPSFHAIR